MAENQQLNMIPKLIFLLGQSMGLSVYLNLLLNKKFLQKQSIKTMCRNAMQNDSKHCMDHAS